MRRWFASLAFIASTNTQTDARMPRTPNVGWANRMISLMPHLRPWVVAGPSHHCIDADQWAAGVNGELSRPLPLPPPTRGGEHYEFGTLRSSSASQAVALPSEGARQSPRGDSEPPAVTLGPFGIAERLN